MAQNGYPWGRGGDGKILGFYNLPCALHNFRFFKTKKKYNSKKDFFFFYQNRVHLENPQDDKYTEHQASEGGRECEKTWLSANTFRVPRAGEE